MTQWSDKVSPDSALPEYPRPQMMRSQWLNLNGLWDYQITEKGTEAIPGSYQGKIMVPFPIESAMSGIMRPLQPSERLWYHRSFTPSPEWAGKQLLLNFEAVDWQTTVYLNGQKVGDHLGGFDSFFFDITHFLNSSSSQELVVSVWDPTNTALQLRGKQTLRPGGASYTACSGIWQTVWLEPVEVEHIESLRMVSDLTAGVLHVTVGGRIANQPKMIDLTASDGSHTVASTTGRAGAEISPEVWANKVKFYKGSGDAFTTTLEVPIPNAKLWSVENPFLYDLKLVMRSSDGSTRDSVQSYFGMRSIGIGHDDKGNTRPLLNGKPILLCGALDQGYWPDGVYTAPTDDALRFDIEFAKRLGLNALRKHVKHERKRWYYWADKLGMLVFQDFPSGNEGDPHTDLPRSEEAFQQNFNERKRLIEQHWNHPSIVCWIMFNEGWGQCNTLHYAAWAKELDPSRLIDEASGFPWHGGGDVADNHGGVPPRFTSKIGITSEDGGFGVGGKGHVWTLGTIWTYRTCDPATGAVISGMVKQAHGDLPEVTPQTVAWMTSQVGDLYKKFIANANETGQSGDFFCQLVDVETECDGLISYDRAVVKVDVDEINRLTSAGSKGLRS
jgi:beta-galactosidase/beta-glucuronidase